jgi:hypothetical protein
MNAHWVVGDSGTEAPRPTKRRLHTILLECGAEVQFAMIPARDEQHFWCHSHGKWELASAKSQRKLSKDSPVAVNGKRKPRGAAPKPRLTPEQVREVRRRLDCGDGFSQIARELKVNRSTIRNIAIGKTWKEV